MAATVHAFSLGKISRNPTQSGQAGQDPAPAGIVAALRMWSAWSLDVPPTGPTGDAALDKRLACAFRALAHLPDAATRFAWIENRLFTTNDFPPPNAPVDRYRETLMRWWQDIYQSQ